MIALKPIELYSVLPLSNALTESTEKPIDYSENTTTPTESICNGENVAQVLKTAGVENIATYDKKGSRVLEQRLHAVRKELEQQSREHSRLLEMIRLQATRLASMEPLPGLFLSRLEEVLCLIESKSKDGSFNETIATPDELDKRFNRGIAQLRLLLNRDHVLENKELLEELTQTKLALQAKRDETLQLRVEQEHLNQRLAGMVEKVTHFDTEIALRKYVKESEARHHKLFVDRRSIRNRHGAASFTFVGSQRSLTKQQPWQMASIIAGLALGCAFTLFIIWITY